MVCPHGLAQGPSTLLAQTPPQQQCADGHAAGPIVLAAANDSSSTPRYLALACAALENPNITQAVLQARIPSPEQLSWALWALTENNAIFLPCGYCVYDQITVRSSDEVVAVVCVYSLLLPDGLCVLLLW